MKSIRFYTYLHRQILIMIGLMIVPGFGYLLIGWLNGVLVPTLVWYGAVMLVSFWGYRIYRTFRIDTMSQAALSTWYRYLILYFYGAFTLWSVVFFLYVSDNDFHLHYIALFTQIGASVVASILLSSERRLYRPTITILMIPLIAYFLLIEAWYGYLLAYFAVIFTWVLFYSSRSSYDLLTQAEHEASHDQLTGLYNRYNFISLFQRHLNTLRETGEYSYLLLIDLDHFKSINDSLGHDVGDSLLQEVAARIQEIAGEEVLARLGGDEFVIIGGRYRGKGECVAAAEHLSQSVQGILKERFVIERHHLFISASIGVSLIDKETSSATTFIKEADIAMYEVKTNGRDDVSFFNEALAQRIEKKLTLEHLLHFAVEKEEIFLHYQPQLNRDQKVTGCEVLARWHNKELGMVPPDEFIPVAESTGLMIEIGRFILEESFKTLERFDARGIVLEQFSINISIRQFLHNSFFNEVEALCKHYPKVCARQVVVFEITESILAEDIKKVIEVMERLRGLGIRFSLDDFGTGYSSLNYLKQLPIDELKIDRTFVRDLPQNESDLTMVITILGLAKTFGLTTVAEGIETLPQFELLREQGCEMVQGYHFSKPVEREIFIAFYEERGGAREIIEAE